MKFNVCSFVSGLLIGFLIAVPFVMEGVLNGPCSVISLLSIILCLVLLYQV